MRIAGFWTKNGGLRNGPLAHFLFLWFDEIITPPLCFAFSEPPAANTS